MAAGVLITVSNPISGLRNLVQYVLGLLSYIYSKNVFPSSNWGCCGEHGEVWLCLSSLLASPA
jgi:hypothetical protein